MKNITISLIFSSFALLLILFVSKNNGLGVNPDAASYLEVSNNLIKGKGFTNFTGDFVNHWPPLYPVSISLISYLTKISITQSARILSIISVFFLFLFFNLILNKFKINSINRIILNTILLISSPVSIYTILSSETLFITELLALIHLIFIWQEKNKFSRLIIIAVFIGIMTITRYVGIAIFGGFAVYLLFFEKKRLKSKIIHIASISAVYLLVVSSWFIYSKIVSGNSANREINFHPVVFYHIKSFFTTLIQWIYPWKTTYGIIILSIIFVLALFFKNKTKNFLSSLYHVEYNKINILLSIIVIYYSFLILSITFADAQTPLDNRLLSPTFPILLLIAAPVLEKAYSKGKYKKYIFIFAVTIIVSMSNSAYYNYKDIYLNGFSYTTKKWKTCQTMNILSGSKAKIIYSNGSDVVGFYYPSKFETIIMIPRMYSPNSLKINQNFEIEFEEMKNEILKNKALLVFFDYSRSRIYLPNKNEVLKRFEEFKITKYEDGFTVESPEK